MRLRTEPGHRAEGVGCGPEPVSAFVLAALEARRRDLVKQLGPCRTGCQELDDHVLLAGGFERGCVVGISAEDEDGFGMVLGCQVVSNALLERGPGRTVSALFITPKPASVVLAPLRNSITAALTAEGRFGSQDVAKLRGECLDRIMLSCVFDVDGLCEVLADLDRPAPATDKCSVEQSREQDILFTTSPSAGQGGEVGPGSRSQSSSTMKPPLSPVLEIRDSQDDADDEDEPEQEAQSMAPKDITASRAKSSDKTAMERDGFHDHNHNYQTNNKPPAIIIITHFSTMLTNLFTQREKSIAHSMAQLVASRLRHLSRTLSSNPLIILLNSTDAIHTNVETHAGSGPMTLFTSSLDARYEAARIRAIDPSLRSIFLNYSPSSLITAPGDGTSHHIQITNRPSFGMIFAQLLDLHLLCTRIAETMRGVLKGSALAASVSALSPRYVTIVEILLDELGLWEGKEGKRKSREQRWAAFDVSKARIVRALNFKTGGATWE